MAGSYAASARPCDDAESDESIEEDIVRDVMKESVMQSNLEQDSKGSNGSKPMARFVRDITMPDSSIVSPGNTFEKVWLVRNDGEIEWPIGTRLAWASGDNLNAEVSPISNNVLPGHEITITAKLTAPSQEGRFVSYFRLQHGDSDSSFGQRLWCDVRVVESPPDNGDYCTEADAAIPQAIAEAISSVMCDEANPHEALSKLLRTWTMVNHADSSSYPPTNNHPNPNPNTDSSSNASTATPPACTMPNTVSEDVEGVAVCDNTEGHEDDWRQLWSHEVTLLEAMGFGDAIGASLPLLQQYLQTPLSMKVSKDEQPTIDAEGFQKVVNDLLSIRARDMEATSTNSTTSNADKDTSYVSKVSA